MKTTTALAVAKAFCTHWVFSYGPLRYILSENGTQFTAKFFLEVCRELGIANVFTTASHPQTNGQVERFNRTILNALRTYVAKNQADWDDYTSAITYGYNSRIHASLGFAPFELVLSIPPPPLALEQPIGKDHGTPEEEKRLFVHRLKTLVPLAKEGLVEAQRKYKENFDKNARVANPRFCPNSWIFLRKESSNPEGKYKLDEIAEGPYRVIKSEGHTLVIRIGEDDVRVSTTRSTRAPRPQTEALLHGTIWMTPIGNYGMILQVQLRRRQMSRSTSWTRLLDYGRLMMERGAISFAGMATHVKMTHGNRLLTSLTT
jgi:hypothetical protein